jgi:hypothetical protein
MVPLIFGPRTVPPWAHLRSHGNPLVGPVPGVLLRLPDTLFRRIPLVFAPGSRHRWQGDRQR